MCTKGNRRTNPHDGNDFPGTGNNNDNLVLSCTEEISEAVVPSNTSLTKALLEAVHSQHFGPRQKSAEFEGHDDISESR